MPRITIIGVKDETYIKNEGEKNEKEKVGCRIFYQKREKGVEGFATGEEYLSFSKFPDEVNFILQSKANAIGLECFISKDVRQFNGKAYAYIDSFEILE